MSRKHNRPTNQPATPDEELCFVATRASDVPQQQLAPGLAAGDLVEFNEASGLYERAPLATVQPMPTATTVAPATTAIAPPPEVFAASVRSQVNQRRLAAAHDHIERLFALAEKTQIGGRTFWGVIALTIAFQDGQAQDVQWSIEARDRCSGGRAA
jgi:hypothetical protein